ncbi:hypothetical protein [Halarcobacter bivalviorum]|uniref:Uncharacterized protein n=1 Tax=Halarcobacter bivalviorum TaxID=663364 RepID=A0AAX2A5Z9_9BACT|nr:hypothetical protein [Halarcobacter bivalviorum]AXH12993.1 hypothetical protein ABIV_2016 [Halarcobacter bivalviorum]RXK09200.1 hypothetical protein CRV05_11495 [Halarcobacter bivalviorum]
MTFIPASTQLLQAIKTNNATKVEELLLDSDTKRDLIVNHINEHGKESLVNLIPQFRSKGLILSISSLIRHLKVRVLTFKVYS